jgi:coproporphyrinogen III oxidase-like Fe-S oxidoreductase
MVRYEPLKDLHDAGMRALCMGIQANDRVSIEFYNRRVTNQQIIDAQKVFRQVGIRANLQLIWDDPESTEQDKDELFRMLMELPRPFELYLFGLTIYPETHLARRLLREGRITEEDIEGVGTHAFEQFRVDLSYPRPKADKRWLALIVLMNKPFLPKSLIWKLYEAQAFHDNPEPLVAMAQAANLVKMAGVVAEMTKNGEMTPLLIKRWFNPRSLVTM